MTATSFSPALEQVLEELERRLDPAVEDLLLAQWADFTDGKFRGDLFRPRRERKVALSFAPPKVRINRALEDEEAMLLSQYGACLSVLAAGGGQLLNVRSNYGTGILPSLFGAELFVMDDAMDTLPTTRALPGIAALEAAAAGGAPDPQQAGLGRKVFATGRRYVEVARRYPKIAKYVRIYHPDLQSPMDVVELLWGSTLFLDVFDRPELVHALLRTVTDSYIRFHAEWEKLVPPPAGHAVHWGLMHAGRIMLRDDSAMNFSPEMYDTFIRPYDAELLRTFGGGAVHFCGRGDHYIASCCSIPGMHAIAMSQPEYNDMEAIYRHTVDRGIKLINFSKTAAEAARARGRDLHGCVQTSA
jgi:hypothetical protein